jgi:hypothetical protein
MTTTHTWHRSQADQRCQECGAPDGWWVLTIKGSMSGEELLCADCAEDVARQFGLSDPTTSSADVESTSAQTSETAGGCTPAVSTSTNASEER